MNIKIGAVKKLTDCRWLNLFNAEFVMPNGHQGTWQFVSRKSEPRPGPAPLVADAVIIVPFLKTGNGWRLVILKEFRVPIGDFEYAFPAGLPDGGAAAGSTEALEAAAVRELKEESGLDVTRIVRVTTPHLSSSGLSDECASYVFVECTGNPSTAGTEGTEVIEVITLDYDDVCRLCDTTDPQVKFSAKTWPFLLMYKLLGKIVPPA
jgi:ADP-ribose pyrophosphatase